MGFGLKSNEIATKNCPEEAQFNRRKLFFFFALCSERRQVSFRVDGEWHPDPLTMACCSRNAPFAFTSTKQSRRGSLPSAHSYASPFSSKYPHLAALGDFFITNIRLCAYGTMEWCSGIRGSLASGAHTERVSRSIVPMLFCITL